MTPSQVALRDIEGVRALGEVSDDVLDVAQTLAESLDVDEFDIDEDYDGEGLAVRLVLGNGVLVRISP